MALSSSRGPAPSPAASAFTTPMARLLKSAATARAASPHGWPRQSTRNPVTNFKSKPMRAFAYVASTQLKITAIYCRSDHRDGRSHDCARSPSLSATAAPSPEPPSPPAIPISSSSSTILIFPSQAKPGKRSAQRSARIPIFRFKPTSSSFASVTLRNRNPHLRTRRWPHDIFRHRQFRIGHRGNRILRMHSPLRVVAPGGAQTVTWQGPGSELYLTGPASLIARGEAWYA